jgi:hypothetical protein
MMDGGAMEEDGGVEEIREQDRYLPVANIARIMKKARSTTLHVPRPSNATPLIRCSPPTLRSLRKRKKLCRSV